MKNSNIMPISILILFLIMTPIIGKSLFPGLTHFFLHVATFICIMIIMSLGLHIFFGMCGQINFGINGFYAAGGYITSLLIIKLHLHFFVALPLAVIGTGILTLFVGLAVLRLRHWVLALGTAAFGFATFISLRTVGVSFLGGDDGLFVPKLILLGKKCGPIFYYYFILGWTILSILSTYFLENSRVGRAMLAIREEETAALVIGIDVNHYIRMAFLLNGLYCGLAGGIYAQWNRGVSPDNFSVHIAMMVLVFVVVGGLGRLGGAVVGPLTLVILTELLIPLKEYEMLIYAFIFFLVIRFMPDGIWGAFHKHLGKFWGQVRSRRES